MTANTPRALVTGGSTGIGRCIAELLARDGCDVGILHVDPPEQADEVVAAIEARGRRGWTRVCNVADSGEVHAAVNEFVAEFGGIEILVNNAGIFRDQVLWKMTDEQWNDVIGVDLTGVFHCSRAVVPFMRENNFGRIVNISSINGLRGKFGQTNYSAAKAGVIGFTKALAREVAKFNVTVNAVAPGYIRTAMFERVPEKARNQAISEILLGCPGEVEDVAEMVVFLCGERGRFITGETIRVDGGQYI